MARRGSRDLSVGVLFALALTILALGIMAVGEESRLFARKVEYRAGFPNTDGLSEGSPVKMAGVQVGTVSRIRLPIDPGQAGIEVELAIDRAYAPRVREDSKTALRIVQYLTGEKSVEITPGDPEQPELPPGSLLELGGDRALFEQVGEASQNLNDITVSLKRILTSIEEGHGLVGKMFSDDEFGEEALASLQGSLLNLRGLTDQLVSGQGLMGRLIYDREIAGRLDQLGQAVEDVAALVSRIDLEQGAAGELLREGGAGQLALQDLRESASAFRRVIQRVEAGEGLIGSMLASRDQTDSVERDLAAILSNLAEITDKINRGEGTLGALINDRVLHDGAEEVVSGVNDSKFARWLLRHYQKKGIQLEDERQQKYGQDDSSAPQDGSAPTLDEE